MKKIFGFILGLVICSTVVVLANSITASDVEYKNNTSVSEALDSLYDKALAGVGNDSIMIDENESNVLSSLTVSATASGSDINVTITPTFKNGYSANNILEYILLVDGVAYKSTTSNSVTIENFTISTVYVIRAIAVDKNANLHIGTVLNYTSPDITYSRAALDYPIVTADGIMNVKNTAYPDDLLSYYEFDATVQATNAKALPTEVFDGDSTTVAGPYNTTYKYVNIDPSARGKTLKITTNGKFQRYYFGYTENIGGVSSVSTRNATYTMVIPSDATILTLYGNESLSWKEITVIDTN